MNAVHNIDVAELVRLSQGNDVELLDVRTESEVARGAIAGARHIPLHLLPARVQELNSGQPLVVYCQSGGRSAQACAWLGAQGFSQVYNLAGGVLAWVREGQQLVMPT